MVQRSRYVGLETLALWKDGWWACTQGIYPPWQQMAPCQTLQDLPLSHFHCSMELGEQQCRPFSAADNVPSSSSSLSSWLLHVCKDWVKGCTYAETSCQWEQPCSRKNSLLQTMPSNSRCPGLSAAASWWHCQGPPLQVSLHSPYTGSSVKAWVWWQKAQPKNMEFISGTSFATYIILPGPAPHDAGVTLSIQSLHRCALHRKMCIHNCCTFFRHTQLEQLLF